MPAAMVELALASKRSSGPVADEVEGAAAEARVSSRGGHGHGGTGHGHGHGAESAAEADGFAIARKGVLREVGVLSCRSTDPTGARGNETAYAHGAAFRCRVECVCGMWWMGTCDVSALGLHDLAVSRCAKIGSV